MTFHLPSFLPRPDLVTTVAALGTVLGVYLFVRGFNRLQRAPVASTSAPTQSASRGRNAVTITSRISDEVVKNAQAEVVRLTPEQSTSLMSQQSRIAAALHKAGISNPVSWNGGGDQSNGNVQIADDELKNLPAFQPEKLKYTQTQSLPSDHGRRLHPEKAKSTGKAGWMLWLGGALALTGAYALSFHLGLL